MAPRIRIRLKGEISQAMLNRVISRTVLNDSREAAVVRQILEAAAQSDELLYLKTLSLLELFSLDSAFGEDLDERAKDFGLEREGAKSASGAVQFSRASTIGIVTIAIGTRIAKLGSPQVTYVTTQSGVFADGAAISELIPAVAITAGLNTDAEPGTIRRLLSRQASINSVTNPVRFTGGQNVERDEDFRERLRGRIRSLALSTPRAIEALSLAVDLADGRAVRAVQLTERDDQPGRFVVYADDGSGTIDASAIVTIPSETIIAAATGGENLLQTAQFPIAQGTAFKLEVNSVLQTRGTDYHLIDGPGSIRLDESSFPTGLTIGDAVTVEYSHYVGLLAELQWRIDGRQDNRTRYPGWRGAGGLGRALPARAQFTSVQGTLVMLTGYLRETAAARANAEVSRYINSSQVGQDIIQAEIIERVMGLPGVFDFRLTTPPGNIATPDGAVTRIKAEGLQIT